MPVPTEDGVDGQMRPAVDDGLADATPDATVDQSLDANTGTGADAARVDMRVDAAPSCEDNIELSIQRPRDEAPMARGEVFAFEYRADLDAQVELSAPYGEFQRQGSMVEWAPRGGNPGDLPWPWWTGPVELTVTARLGACSVEERFSVVVTGDVLLFDGVDGAIWVVGSGG
ncbi:MAG: hypothetical protein ACI9U2_002073 [Bradymonadia bacterium]|jgi:hypothetical protein